MMSRRVRVLNMVGLLLLIGAASTLAQKPSNKHPRARHPEFNKATVDALFFEDVFSVLVGERPRVVGAPRVAMPTSNAGTNGGSSADENTGGGDYGWSKIVSPTTIEDEIKAIKLSVDQDVTTPSQFRSRGYQEVRRHFSVVAMLFHVIHQYDGDVRFQDNAAGARDVFARTAANAKVGTTQVYNEAKLRKQELQDVVSGARFQGPDGAEETEWGKLVDRSPLMERLKIAQNERLRPLTGNQGSFKENKTKVIHEAELVALMAEVIASESMEDGDDETYLEYADRMKAAALEIVSSAKLDNYDGVSKAVGELQQACDECHEGYR